MVEVLRGARRRRLLGMFLVLCAGLFACEPVVDLAPGDLTGEAPPAAPPPRSPIVLAHGFFGFEGFAGADFLTYFFGVADDLRAHGERFVFTPAVDPFNDSFVRGAQLLDHIEQIRASTGAERVIIIGHSQGGLDARVAAQLEPDWIEAVVSYATPHRGSPVADVALRLLPDDRFDALLDALTRLLAAPLYDAVGEETSVSAAMRALSARSAADFDAMVPDAPGVAYYSVTGRSGWHLGGRDCQADDRPAFVTRYDGVIDSLDPLFAVPGAIASGLEAIPNDGLVRVSSARHGRFLGCVPADHLDQIGQLFGDRPGLVSPWDHQRFFRELVDWLRAQGH